MIIQVKYHHRHNKGTASDDKHIDDITNSYCQCWRWWYDCLLPLCRMMSRCRGEHEAGAKMKFHLVKSHEMTAPAPKPLTFGQQLELAAQQLSPGYNTIIVAEDKGDVMFVIMNRTQASGRLKQMEMRMPPETAATLMPDFCRAITRAMNHRVKQQETKKEELPEEDSDQERLKASMARDFALAHYRRWNPNGSEEDFERQWVAMGKKLPEEDKRG